MNDISAKPGLNFWMLTALVVGNMIGSGIFLLPASLAPYGTMSIFSWLFTTAGALFLALMFVNLNHRFPQTGGPYVYCRQAFGDFAGFMIAYNYWVAVWVANAAVAVALIGYLGVFWSALNHDAHLSFWVEVSAVWLFTGINILGVRSAGIVQLITTVLKTLPLLAISIVGLFKINPHYLAEFNLNGVSHLGAFTSAATLTLWAFIGLESAVIPSEDAENSKDIPKATIYGTLLAALIYILGTLAIMGLIPAEELKNSQAPYADAARLLFGSGVEAMVAVGAIVSCLGALNGWILLQAQVPMAAARDGIFFTVFAKKSRFKTPMLGQIISSLLVTALLALTLNKTLVSQFTFIILLATLAYLVPYFFCALAELRFLFKEKAKLSDKRFLRNMAIAVLACGYSAWTIIGSGIEVIAYGVCLSLLGIPFYRKLWHRKVTFL